jgi:SAM-dependent methyltransferase
VLTTDIDTRHLQATRMASVDVREHDILVDSLPEGSFDLAYARLVLEHLVDPDAAIARMIAALKPGGWLLVEDFEILPDDGISKTAAVMRQVTAAAAFTSAWAVRSGAGFGATASRMSTPRVACSCGAAAAAAQRCRASTSSSCARLF